MIGIVVITHGKLSEELKETARLIMGDQNDFHTVTFTARESLDALRAKAREAIDRFRDSGCLVLTDVLGGSATNVCVELLQEDWIRVITGVNLPMVMEALQNRQTLDLPNLSHKVRDGAARAIIDLKEFYQQRMKKKA
ncbi:MAG TPA: PTS sugar transporter subunit IIA [Candidatus Ozemobacteraceae bacterium]|nr:PTS sugar transporter subunit IIA [Candidatus Ozemobacteraceae bacterium]